MANELGYVAGLFDGEGTVFVSRGCDQRKNEYHKLEVAIVMTDRRPLDQVKELFGGEIYPKNDVGYAASKTGHRNYWRWVPRKKEMETFLITIVAYVWAKREQVEVALHFLEDTQTYRRQGQRGKMSPEARALREGYRLALQSMKK